MAPDKSGNYNNNYCNTAFGKLIKKDLTPLTNLATTGKIQQVKRQN